MNLQDMKGAVILLALIALIGSAAAIALNDFRADIGSKIDSTQTVNETITWIDNTTWVALTNQGGAKLSCDYVDNASGNVPIDSSAYTCSASRGILVVSGSLTGGEVTPTLNVTYSWAQGDEAYNTSSAGLLGVANTTSYLGTIGTIIGVAVLIGIVVLAFTFAKR